MNQHFIDPNDGQHLIEALEAAAARKWPSISDQQHSLFGRAAQALRKTDKPEQPTLRDYFAAKALPEVMRGEEENEEWNFKEWDSCVANRAYAVADAMLAEREKDSRST